MNDNDKHPDSMVWWKHRRRHAYISLAWIILQTPAWAAVAIMFPTSFALLYSVIGFSYTIPTGALAAYYSGSSFQDYLDKVKQ